MSVMSILQDVTVPQTLGIIAVLVASSVGLVVWRWHRLVGAIQAVEGNLDELLAGRRQEPDSRTEGRALWRAVREQLVFPPGKQAVPGLILMRSSPSRELRETTRALFRHSWGHGLGRNLTGIALVMTFGLLGIVLVGPVQQALTSTGLGANSQADLLSQAIGKMGAKFFVSAAGLVGSFLFQAIASSIERSLLGRLDVMRVSFERTTQTLDAHEIALASASKVALGELKGEIAQTRRELSDRLEHLESVEVSIQDIGVEVKTHFGTMMKEQVGDVITRQLSAVEKAVRDIAADLQRSIASGFTLALQQEMATVREHLDAIQKAVAGRQEHDLGRILEQLRDTVSGGFHSQSQDMAQQMAGLIDVLPRLEKQFEAMTQTLGNNARQWGSENHRAIETLGEKVSELVGSFDRVRDDMEKAVSQVLRGATMASHELGQQNQQVLSQLESSVSGIVSSFKEVLDGMRESSKQMVGAAAQVTHRVQESTVQQSGALNHQVESLRHIAMEGMDGFQAQSKEFAKVMGETQEGLRSVTKQMGEAAEKLVAATRGAGETHNKASGVSTKMEEVAQRLIETATVFHKLTQERAGVIKQEETLLNAQRQALAQVTPVLSGLTRTYEESVSRQAQVLSSQWTEVMRRLDSVVDRTSGELVQGVDDLTETVQQLKEALRQQVRKS
ncbi:hypothetical protein [Corallococcus terminator]|nr:hypothetical protein [Corallococcus terminator]